MDLLHGHARHEVAVPDDALEIAFLPQPCEPFADRRAAHAVLGSEAHLRKRLAGPVSSLDDAGLEICGTRARRAGRLGARTRTGFHDALSSRAARRGVYRWDPTSNRRKPRLPCYSAASPSRLARGSFDQPFRGGNDPCARVLVRSFCAWRRPVAAAAREAQYRRTPRQSNRATGEKYHVELAGTHLEPDARRWSSPANRSASPATTSTSSTTLGIEQTKFKQLKIVLRPATKHKFRFEYTPINYDAQKVDQHVPFIFNGQLRHRHPGDDRLQWKAYRFGYEWDFIYRDRGFAGVCSRPNTPTSRRR